MSTKADRETPPGLKGALASLEYFAFASFEHSQRSRLLGRVDGRAGPFTAPHEEVLPPDPHARHSWVLMPRSPARSSPSTPDSTAGFSSGATSRFSSSVASGATSSGPSGPASGSLAELVPSAWREALEPVLHSPSFAELERFLMAEASEARVFPPREFVFAALARTPPERVKVVMLGQDPYPTHGNANGLAFSVTPGVKVPASLRNLFEGLQVDLGVAKPTSGDLGPWADRGVLLLNTVLTVREGASGSHRKKGWEALTDAVVGVVNRRPGSVVFVCLGAHAKAMVERLVDGTRHAVLSAPHPSPLNGKAFVRAVERERLFSRVNAVLSAAGVGPVDWALP